MKIFYISFCPVSVQSFLFYKYVLVFTCGNLFLFCLGLCEMRVSEEIIVLCIWQNFGFNPNEKNQEKDFLISPYI